MYLRLLTILFLSMSLSLPCQANSIETYLSDSALAQKNGDFKGSLIHLKNAVKSYPDNKNIRLELVDTYILTGQGALAEIELNKAQSIGATLIDTKARRIKSQLLQSEFKQVTAQVDTILKLPIKQIAEIRALQGQAYLSQNNKIEAKAYFFRASRLDPDGVEVQIGLARLYTIDNKKEEAKKLIESLIKKAPNNVRGLLLAGNMYMNEKKFSKSLELFERASNIQPSSIAAWLGKVNSLIELKEYEKANTQIQTIIDLDSENEMANYLQAIIAFHLKDVTKSLQSLRAVQKKNPEHQGALWLSGLLFYHQKRFDESEKQLVKFLQYQPNHLPANKTLAAVYIEKQQGSLVINLLTPFINDIDADISALLGSAYQQIGNNIKASEYFEIAAKLSPENKQIQDRSSLNRISLGQESDMLFTDQDFSDFAGKGHIYIISLIKSDKLNEAIKLLSSYQKSFPDNTTIINLLGNAYLLQDKYDLAKELFSSALAIDRKSVVAQIGLAQISAKTGQLDDAKRHYEKVLANEPGNLITLMNLAKLNGKEQNYKQLIKMLEQARKLNPGAIEPRQAMHKYFLRIGAIDKALTLSSELIELQPENTRLLKLHADTLLAKNDISSAIRIYKKIVTIQPKLAAAYYWLGTSQYLWKQYDQAKVNFDKSLQLGFKGVMASAALINIALIKNELASAMTDVDSLIAQYPDAAVGYELKADIYMRQQQYLQALALYETALKKQPDSQIIQKRFLAQVKVEGIVQARESLEKWLIDHPDDMDLKISLAMAYQQDKLYGKAIKHYEEILQRFPKHITTINNLAMLYSEQDDIRSVEYAEIAYAIAPEQPEIQDTLGWILLKNKQNKRAVLLLAKAVSGAPSNSDIRYHYAKALVISGDKKKAAEQLYMIVPLDDEFEARKEAEQLLEEINSTTMD
ncbi:MAG: PEP-CTERM system TPR-repeat protein PrsT [Gammaproteobacteria bacterium]|nr:PEP-CTERM system TPR-repeat protein PrsT [Gammaproteobacteria bacterium]